MKKNLSAFGLVIVIITFVNLVCIGMPAFALYELFNPFTPQVVYENNFMLFWFGPSVVALIYISMAYLIQKSNLRFFKKCRRYAGAVFMLAFVVVLSSCGDSKWSKSGQRAEERKKAIADSIAKVALGWPDTITTTTTEPCQVFQKIEMIVNVTTGDTLWRNKNMVLSYTQNHRPYYLDYFESDLYFQILELKIPAGYCIEFTYIKSKQPDTGYGKLISYSVVPIKNHMGG